MVVMFSLSFDLMPKINDKYCEYEYYQQPNFFSFLFFIKKSKRLFNFLDMTLQPKSESSKIICFPLNISKRNIARFLLGAFDLILTSTNDSFIEDGMHVRILIIKRSSNHEIKINIFFIF